VVSTPTFRPEALLQAEIKKFVLDRDKIGQWLGSSEGRTEKE